MTTSRRHGHHETRPHGGHGRVAVVTGGGRGLGLAITRLLAQQGALVVIGSRSADSLERTAQALREDGLEVHARPCDVTVRDDVLALRDEALRLGGRIDAWVNNAGRAGAFGPVSRIPEADFLGVTDTVIRGTYYGSLAALDVMEKQGHGDLVNLLGRGDDGPTVNQAAYGSAKSWVRAFTGALAAEHKDSGVRIHAFNPGLVRTDMLGRIDAVSGYGERLHPLEKVVGIFGATPEEAAVPLLHLLGSDRAEYRGTAPVPMVRRAGINLLDSVRGRGADPLTIQVKVVDDRESTLGNR